jgi:segregation and condensation protein A
MLNNNKDFDQISQSKQFNISLNSYEGPIDLLLDLARKQKVDLSEISILELAEQYINFINKYQDIHLEIAADYLVMASWLTYLKSRLLLPKEEKTEDHTPEDLEEALKYQLQRLEAFQSISKNLYARSLIGRDVFYGGSSEGVKVKYNINYSSTLFDLLHSYSTILQKDEKISHLTIAYSELYSVDNAIQRLKDIFGDVIEWTNFLSLIPKLNYNKIINKSILSSNFVASLELAKNGYIDVKQNNIFGNIFVKLRK